MAFLKKKMGDMLRAIYDPDHDGYVERVKHKVVPVPLSRHWNDSDKTFTQSQDTKLKAIRFNEPFTGDIRIDYQHRARDGVRVYTHLRKNGVPFGEERSRQSNSWATQSFFIGQIDWKAGDEIELWGRILNPQFRGQVRRFRLRYDIVVSPHPIPSTNTLT